jgi:hypothetical protein
MQNHIERDHCMKAIVCEGQELIEISRPEIHQIFNSPLASHNPRRMERSVADFEPDTTTAPLLRYESQDAARTTPEIEQKA